MPLLLLLPPTVFFRQVFSPLNPISDAFEKERLLNGGNGDNGEAIRLCHFLHKGSHGFSNGLSLAILCQFCGGNGEKVLSAE
jgi:hypothetical protein